MNCVTFVFPMSYFGVTIAYMKHKGSPTSIRFDNEKVEFVKQREKLKSGQQVVDFLLNKYWWECKVHKPTYRDVPPIKIEEHTIAKMQPTTQLKIEPIRIVKTIVQYHKEISGSLDYPEELKQLEKEIKADSNLTSVQKRDLLALFGAK